MSRRFRIHRRVADPFIELRCSLRIGTKSERSVTALGSPLEIPDQRAPDASSAYVGANIYVTQSPDTRVVDVRIRRHSSNRQQLLAFDQCHEELARRVERDTVECKIIEKPPDEPEPLGVGESGKLAEGGKVCDAERTHWHWHCRGENLDGDLTS